MSALHARSTTSSIVEMSDLDGYSVPADYSFNLQNHADGSSIDDFGFDPPTLDTVYPKLETYSPIEVDSLALQAWPMNPTRSKDSIQSAQLSVLPNNDLGMTDLSRAVAHTTPGSVNAISRYGQVTPPRSNSASSVEMAATSPKTAVPEKRRRNTKATPKEETTTTTPSSRKRKSTRKASVVSEEQDDKRKQSLEKNRLAAAKCRINKKEKTEQLQRDSHDKAVHNALLKEQVMRMTEELQQMNAVLLSHANCEGCKSPEEIQNHLNKLGSEVFAHHMGAFDYDSYSPVHLSADMVGIQSDFYGPPGSDEMMNPPLPDFDSAAEFEVNSPMHTD